MRRDPSSLLVSLCLALTGCSFSPHAITDDSPIDAAIDAAAAVPKVGFMAQTSMTDHDAGTIMIPVVVTGTLAGAVTVHYAISGGDAISGTDFTFAAGDLTFTDGQAQGIPVTILPVGVAETDKTIVLQLTNPMNAALDTNEQQHTITISPQVLPRVSFKTPTSSVPEASTTKDVEIDLDKMSPVDVHVTFSIDPTSSAQSPANFTLPVSVTIPAGQLSAQAGVTIADDSVFGDNLVAVIDLMGADTADIGAANRNTLTIVEGDAAPVVAFKLAAQPANETDGTATLVVTVAGATRLPITVPFGNVAGGTSADIVDFSYVTPSPLTIDPGTVTANIVLDLAIDTDCIDNETVATAIDPSNLVNATAGATSQTTLTIHDDTFVLVGPGAGDPFEVCLDPKPTAPTAIAANTVIDTDGAAPCLASPFGWTATQPDACFVVGTDISIGANVSATGSKPLVFVASGAITVGSLDVSSNHTGLATAVSGPGLPPTGAFSDCSAFLQNPQASNGAGAGGGAGGTFMSPGGNGGKGDNNNRKEGLAPGADATPPPALRPGCDGQLGGTVGANSPGLAGRGGGAVYLVAGTTLTLTNAVIDASGAGAQGNATGQIGGSGGGSGGMIKLFAATIVSAATTKLFANGGGASSGAANGGASVLGADPTAATANAPTPGGMGGGSTNGGTGFGGPAQATTGAAASNKGGGGGGGGGGLIQSNKALTGVHSAGSVVIGP